MIPIPDLSYFAVPGFINEMRQRPVYTASLILQDGQYEDWDDALSDEEDNIYTWIHNQTANEHDVYLPFTIRSSFFQYYIQHLKTIVEPAAEMIRKYLTELGVTDIDEYMKDSDDWLSLLFADRKCHYAASHIAAEGFNINIEELPAIVIWTGLDRRSVVIIYPYSRVDYMKDYIRAIYRSIVEVSRDLIQADRSININIFKDRLENSIEAEPYRENMFIKVRSIERRRLDRPSSVIKTIWK